MQNFIALDRNVHTKGSANLISRGGKNGPPAQDYFHVSHYADMESLINHCGNTTSEDLCTHVEQVAFERKAFSFAELVVLASTISEACPSYQLSATNCYWFASLIWECMLDVFRGGVARHNKLTEERGRFRGIKIQGNHSNFQGVVDKYKNDVVEFMKGLRDDAISVVDRRSRRFSALLPDPSEYDEKSSTSSITTAESRRPRTVSTVALGTSASVSRAQVSGPEKDRKSERARATSLCPTSKSQDPTTRLSASMNKDLPRRRMPERVLVILASFQHLPETVKRGSNRYSDIGKSFEEATVVYNQPNRPASYVNPTSKQVQFESSQSRIPDNVRLKVHSLPSHPVSPGGDLNKDRPRSPSLPVGATPTETREASKDSQNSTPESSTEPAPRARTMSGLNRLRRALPKLLLPTVSESEGLICESPELSSWTEIESADYEPGHPFADGASERLSFIEFPQPPGSSLPPGLREQRRSSAASGTPGVRVAQGHRVHRVHPSRVEYADGSRKRRSQSPAVGSTLFGDSHIIF
ncbi:hypothetical protein OPQ81_011154 [Rhizoctonia solani]|nr:hypothetical protein OPQ81_011154 [Rhizoctonia solani]